MSIDTYCQQFNVTSYDLLTKQQHEKLSNNIKEAARLGKCSWQKGGKNPAYDEECRAGRRSPWSMNYIGYDGLSDDEKHKRISTLGAQVQDTKNKNHNNPLRIDFYIARGYSEDEAKQILAERQCTFSLEKCIEKYGVEEGHNIFNARQEKWQNTLKSKPLAEQQRILKAKVKSIANICGYSKISQELFNMIYEQIKDQYVEIYYATHKQDNENSNKNFEYEVLLEDEIHRYFLDFYVKDNNKVIEFDGDYWHGKVGNKERETAREAHLNRLGFVNILHVKECDFQNNPQQTLEKCLNFIRSK